MRPRSFRLRSHHFAYSIVGPSKKLPQAGLASIFARAAREDEVVGEELIHQCGVITRVENGNIAVVVHGGTATLDLHSAADQLDAHPPPAGLWLTALNPEAHKVVKRSPLGQALGPERMFFNLVDAVTAFEKGAAAPQPHRPSPAP